MDLQRRNIYLQTSITTIQLLGKYLLLRLSKLRLHLTNPYHLLDHRLLMTQFWTRLLQLRCKNSYPL
jgi:hypothetical protein